MSASASSSHTVALNSIASSSGSFRDATIAPYIGDPYPAHPPFTYPQPTPWQVPTAWPTTIVYPATSTASTGAITDGRTALRLVAAGSPPADAATAVARLRTELLLAENHDETLVALLARLAAELLTGNNGSAQEIAKQALELLDDAGETVEDSDGVDDTEPFWDQP